ncbi:MAG: YceI family protein [Chitinophagaceae bacterium]|nr:MAG: YceI family protein [Chitinophagaceae bacterium]
MKKGTFLFALMLASAGLFAQAKKTTSATISFDASTPADPVAKAENKTVIAAINTAKGTVQFEAAVKNFSFENKKVEEHFNAERWLNSAKYPKFSFSGKIDDLGKVKFKKDGTYKVSVTGDLTVKETTKSITVPATIIVSGGTVSAVAAFPVNLPSYGVMADGKKIATDAKVTVSADLN